jgi:purine-nucleoside phosphorylase
VSGTFEAVHAAAQQIRARLPAGARPRVGLILGSGLGAFADTFADRTSVPMSSLPGFPASNVAGHSGNLVHGRAGVHAEIAPAGIEVLALQGRVHYYEGHPLEAVVLPVRALIAAGCSTLIVTNAAGGIDPSLVPGQLVVIADHLNLLFASPLRGENDGRLGPRFPDMTDAYDAGLRALAAGAGRELGLALREGVYAMLPGPSYETPAEVRMLRVLGADLAGMSTVPEVIAARHMGARVLGISCVTNLAAGLTDEKLSHEEVTETAARVRGIFGALLGRVLARLSAEGAGDDSEGYGSVR